MLPKIELDLRKILGIFGLKLDFAPSSVIFNPKMATMFRFLWGYPMKFRTRSAFSKIMKKLGKIRARFGPNFPQILQISKIGVYTEN